MLSQVLLAIWLPDPVFLISRNSIYTLHIKVTKYLHCKDNKHIFKEDNMFYKYQIHICFFQLN